MTKRSPAALLLLLAALGIAQGCADNTDAATRLANDIIEHSKALTKSKDIDVTFVHTPKATPAGCSGAYMVTLSASVRGKLSIGCDKKYPDVSYTTTTHKNAVSVPATISVMKAAGQPLSITLHKGNGRVDLTSIQ